MSATSEPISKMIDRGAKVRWRCDVVQSHYGNVDLKRIAQAKGGNYVLLNRRPPCRIPGCPGIVIFEGYDRQYPIKLETISDRDAEWWDFNEKRRTQLKALGYRMRDGKWVAPGT